LARPPSRTRREPSPREVLAPPAPPGSGPGGAGPFWNRSRTVLAVVLLTAVHLTLAILSLLRENPTVDEVVHLPAGVTYWQKGTFRLYHHNPPLVKLVAALPVVLSDPVMTPLYEAPSWTTEPPSPTAVAQNFAYLNVPRYFELFERARLPMPLFSVLGGIVVFAWSRRLHGVGGGLLSLTLWAFCPNVLAHGRLITTDMGATALGVAATYLFWRSLQRPGWLPSAGVGICLGLAELTKFSLILLGGLWPFLWLVRLVLTAPRDQWPTRITRALGLGSLTVALSILTIDVGYGFEGVGLPLGRFEFACGSLTRPVPPGMRRPRSRNELFDAAWRHRVNRFRGTVLEGLPTPLPKHYVLGFDEQKLETEGMPKQFFAANSRGGEGGDDDDVLGYTVYLDGELRQPGWRSYYVRTLLYKVPEGTWCLFMLSLVASATSRRSREGWADEIAVATVPVVILFAMSFLTNICLGLRYVLPIFPYIMITMGKVVPWASGLETKTRRVAAWGIVGVSLGLTVLATALIHPHYLAYFNLASGGPDREPPRLIDSNLDWGQDLVNLKDWIRAHARGERVGIAYFGQINPSIFALRGEGFDWFPPPAEPGTVRPMPGRTTSRLVGPARRLTPGLYAVSATLVAGLRWRLYDSAPVAAVPEAWSPAWNADKPYAFSYFRELTPIARVGHSILVYRVTPRDIERLARRRLP
jgi:hypothetical protein